MSKRVLFVNPAKEDEFSVDRIHMGLTLMGEILVANGYHVKIVDYAFLRCVRGRRDAPSIEKLIHTFRPDVIGISVFTYVYDECRSLIERIAHCCDAPIILGGPHPTLFPDDFIHDKRISYIARGEAENIILDLVKKARQERWPVLVDCPLPTPQEIPPVNLGIADGSEHLRVYQIQLSRGCPYNCSFCNVRFIAGRRPRARDLETCLTQIVEAKKRYPQIETVTVTDDCPTFDKERFKSFLLMFREAGTGCILSVDNMRANLIDEEMLQLYISAGGRNICLGVESGHPDVFRDIGKGESLNEIITVAKLVREHGLSLGLCFVIGLPGDSLEKHQQSMRLAKALKPDYVFWNMCIPWPGTVVNRWYQEHGEIRDLRNFSTLIDPKGNFREPICSSPNFPKDQMIEAWLAANKETYCLSPLSLKKLIRDTRKRKLYLSLVIYWWGYHVHVITRRSTAMRRILKQFGFRFMIFRMLEKIGNRSYG